MPEFRDRVVLEHPPFSDRTVERYLVGDLDGSERALFEQGLAESPALQAHVAARRGEQEAARGAMPALSFAAAAPATRRPPRWTAWALGSAAVAALLVVGLRRGGNDDDGGVHARGPEAATVAVAVKRGEKLFALPQSDVAASSDRASPSPVLRAGDALRVDLETRVAAAVIIGLVEHAPTGRGQVLVRAEVPPGHWSQPSSLVLDAAPGPEELVVVVVPASDAGLAGRVEQDIMRGVVPVGARVYGFAKEPL